MKSIALKTKSKKFVNLKDWYGNVYAEVLEDQVTMDGYYSVVIVTYTKNRQERKIERIPMSQVRNSRTINMYSIPSEIEIIYFNDKVYDKFDGWIKYETPANAKNWTNSGYERVEPIPMDEPENSLKFIMGD